MKNGLGARATQGLLILVVGVALGLAIGGLPQLHRPKPIEFSVVDTAASSSTTEVPNLTLPTEPATTTTTAALPPAHPPKAVHVAAHNGSKTPGSAGRVLAKLKAAGFATLPAEPDLTPVAASAVYFRPGFDADAIAIAAAVGLDAASVAPLATPPQVSLPAAAEIVILIGNDAPTK
jgi:hypothetical protein